jgi:predicted MFS family arabinose efflux permease
MRFQERSHQGTSPVPDKIDLEASKPPALEQPQDRDPDLATWSSETDPENPKNWPKSTKWKNTWTISLFVFISPISSSMIAPAMQDLGEALDMRSDFEVYLSMAIFILAYAIGPIFFGPASELYGRVRLLQVSNLWYTAWNLGCGFAQTKRQLFAFRFLAGIGGSAPLAIGGGAIR